MAVAREIIMTDMVNLPYDDDDYEKYEMNY